MAETYLKKYLDEEDTWFYIHFQDGYAVRQIEVSSSQTKRLTLDSIDVDGSFVYDQKEEDLDVEQSDYITGQEFENAWCENTIGQF